MVKIQSIEKLFSYDAVVFSYLLLPVLVLLLLFRSRNKMQKSDLLVFLFYGLICFILLFFFWDIPKKDRKFYFAFYTGIEYTIFAYFLWKNITTSKIKSAILVLSVLFYLFQIIYLFSILSIKRVKLDSVPIGVETILLFLYILYFFYDFSRKPGNSYIYNHYCFWLSVGILVYLGGSFFFYILIGHLDDNQIETFGDMTYGAEIIKNILFGIALIVYSKYPLKSTKEKNEPIPYLDMI